MFEKMAEWGLVKYFGSLINPDNLNRRIAKWMTLYEQNSFMKAAKRLIIWAVVIIIVATIIDLTFYWLRPEQKERLKIYKEKFTELKERLFDKKPTRGRYPKR